MRRIAVTILALGLGLSWAPRQAEAFNCQIPALVNPAKKTVCATPLLRAIDDKEESEFKSVQAGMALDARRTIQRDRRTFIATRDGCETDQRCLEATYRAQTRLYTRLARCKISRANQTFCVTTTITKHRQELHNSL